MGLTNFVGKLRVEFKRFVAALLFLVLMILIVIKSGNFNIEELLRQSSREIERNTKKSLKENR